MAKQAVTADIYICDGCGKQEMVKEGELPEGWFLGEAVLVGRFKKGVWNADSERCIRKAVVAVTGEPAVMDTRKAYTGEEPRP